jgi:HEAT repeats
MIIIELRAAAALLSFFFILMLSLVAAAIVRGFACRKNESHSAAVLPEIREALVDYASGSNDLTRLDAFAAKRRPEVARALLEFQGSVGGSALDRLCILALDLGFVREWIKETDSRDPIRRRRAFAQLAFVSAYEPCRRLTDDLLLRALEDPDPEVELAAARALIHTGEPEAVESVFAMAASRSLLIRVLLAEDLRLHTGALCDLGSPAILCDGEPRRTAAALEMMVAWERTVPLQDLDRLLRHDDTAVRIQALRLAPLAPHSAENQAAVSAALEDADPEVVRAAAAASGRMRLAAAIPALTRLLREAPASVARSAAAALAKMPPRGWQILRELSCASERTAAAAAAEALGRLRRKACA